MNIFKVAKFELKKIFRNYWLIIILFLGSIIVVSLVGLVANHSPQDIAIGVYKVKENALTKEISDEINGNKDFSIRSLRSVDEGLNLMKNDKIKGLVIIDLSDNNQQYYEGKIRIIEDIRYPEIQATISQGVRQSTSESLAKNVKSALNLGSINNFNLEPIEIQTETQPGKKITYFDRFASGIIVLVLLLICLQLTAVSISYERESGTFERLSTKPLAGQNVILGKFLADSIVGIFATFLVTFSFWAFFKIALGNLWLVFLIECLVALIAIAIGILISVISYNVAVSVQIAFYAFFAFVITSQLFWTKENINDHAKGIVALSPFTYAIEALKKVNLYNWGWQEIKTDVFYLFGFLTLFAILSILLLKREVG